MVCVFMLECLQAEPFSSAPGNMARLATWDQKNTTLRHARSLSTRVAQEKKLITQGVRSV